MVEHNNTRLEDRLECCSENIVRGENSVSLRGHLPQCYVRGALNRGVRSLVRAGLASMWRGILSEGVG